MSAQFDSMDIDAGKVETQKGMTRGGLLRFWPSTGTITVSMRDAIAEVSGVVNVQVNVQYIEIQADSRFETVEVRRAVVAKLNSM